MHFAGNSTWVLSSLSAQRTRTDLSLCKEITAYDIRPDQPSANRAESTIDRIWIKPWKWFTQYLIKILMEKGFESRARHPIPKILPADLFYNGLIIWIIYAWIE